MPWTVGQGLFQMPRTVGQAFLNALDRWACVVWMPLTYEWHIFFKKNTLMSFVTSPSFPFVKFRVLSLNFMIPLFGFASFFSGRYPFLGGVKVTWKDPSFFFLLGTCLGDVLIFPLYIQKMVHGTT